jgi:FKBP-type peptidyl-prolyl cis-trans isomerase SlyD
MTITDDCVVKIDYTLKDNQGQVLDSSAGKKPLAYLHGKGNIIPGLEKELTGMKVGDTTAVVIEPSEGYGERSEDKVTSVARTQLAQIPDLKEGVQLQAQTEQGVQILTVKEIKEDTVVLDANHPLAGETLNFDVEVVEVRKATDEEMAHGHVHGPDGVEH